VGSAGAAESGAKRPSPVQELLFFGLICAMVYVGGTLPCGRFYYENVDGFFGNSYLRLSYEYIYLYLGVLAHLGDRCERALLGGVSGRGHLSRVAAARTATPESDAVACEPAGAAVGRLADVEVDAEVEGSTGVGAVTEGPVSGPADSTGDRAPVPQAPALGSL
jgi:hypothetical protein